MAFIVKSDAGPSRPSYSYSALAALQQCADRGDAAAAIVLAGLPEPEQRLARGLVTAFSAKAEGAQMYRSSGKRARREAKAKNAMRKASPPPVSIYSHDPREREAAWHLRMQRRRG